MEMYNNRDISWLKFNNQLLLEAAASNVPLLERFKFLSIHASNLDEFFSIRYPVVQAMANLNERSQKKLSKEFPPNTNIEVKAEIERQLTETGKLLESLLIDLEREGIVLYYNRPLQKEHEKEVSNIFLSEVLAFLQPIHIRADLESTFHPEHNKIYFIVSIKDAATGALDHYILNIPSDHLGRFYELEDIDNTKYIIFIDDIIKNNIQHVFRGFDINGIYSIKFNRDAEVDLEDDLTRNILKKVEKQLKKRESAPLSRFLYQYDMPANLLLYMRSIFKIEEPYVFAGGKYHNLRDLIKLPVHIKALNYVKWPSIPPAILPTPDKLFSTLNKSDVLLHLPYQSYNIVLSFFNQAAVDPSVEEIFITLYRVAPDSLILNSLISAVKNGKKVTAFVELKARFDEVNNINWSKKMNDAGINVIYSIPGIKVHSKIALVVRNDHGKTKMYSIMGTGNFNEDSAAIYTDHILLTANKQMNAELLMLFRFLEQRTIPENKDLLEFKHLCVSQFNLVSCLEQYIGKEIQRAKKGKNAFIRIKLNNLEDPGMVDMLYKAAKAGVTIQLIVRGICTLVPDVHPNISLKRIVGRYLEHTRVIIFGEPGKEEILFGSADWMTRNLHRRIEVYVPVVNNVYKQELIDYFNLQWKHADVQNPAADGNETIANTDSAAQYAVYNYLKSKI
jgi:polyphosphate kinase